ncbi:developmental pluripotency-associated protein 2 [Octodon degus]|uniref:Developmental pluripotency-associated protein 2 n=1 Tax=Octodon degus TaxID=10160 RepID=A0A6P3V9L6_OCTDE|nr:developmental pluripotency-associated protein 2 [Octodon degus]
MSDSSRRVGENGLEEDGDEENVILTLVPITEEDNLRMEPDVSSTAGLAPMSLGETDTAHLPQKKEELRPKGKAVVPPLPTVLPPVTEVARDTLRSWCQQFNLSTDGQKIEVYLRLQKHAYPQQECEVPGTSKEAKLQRSFRKRRARTKRMKDLVEGLERSLKEEEANVVEVVTSAQASMLAAWARIAARAGRPRAVTSCPIPSDVEAFLPQALGGRWCVVHGQLRAADVAGWVRLQFCAGDTWVPDTPRRMTSFTLLPACIFPSPGTEDNLLCPECVQRNKKVMRKIIMGEKMRHPVGDQNMPP